MKVEGKMSGKLWVEEMFYGVIGKKANSKKKKTGIEV